MSEHAKIRPPRSADALAAFDLGAWGNIDDGEPHHAFLCAGEDDSSAIAYVAKCACTPFPPNPACPQTQIMLVSRAFFRSLTIVELAPKHARQPKARVRRLKRR